MDIQKIPYEGEHRIETGPLEIGDDWPGTFIRGDDSLHYYMNLGRVLSLIDTESLTFTDTMAVDIVKELKALLDESNLNIRRHKQEEK